MKRFILLLFWLCWCVACDEVIVDPLDPRLPKYTETGEDTAGALINGEVWVSSDKDFFSGNYASLWVYVPQDSVVFRLDNSGQSEVYADIYFQLSGLGVRSVEDVFRLLDNRLIVFDGLQNAGRLEVSADQGECSILSANGQVHFRVARSGETGLAGTFGFTAESPECGRFEVFYGRFDFDKINITLFEE